MQTYFTKEVIQAFKVIVLGLAIGLGVTFVSANWTAPTSTAPNCPAGQPGCDAPINVSDVIQSKGGPAIPGITYNVYGTASADTLGAFSGFFVGTNNSVLADDAINIFGTTSVKLSKYQGPKGRNALNLVGSNDNDSVGVIQNKPWFFLWDYSTNKRASLRAHGADFEGSVQIADGTQGVGKVFASTDANGLGAWADMPTIPVPDIKIVEESWSDINDGQSRSLSCPADLLSGDSDYAAIAVTCDSDKDDGVDTCYIMDGGGAFDFNGRQTQNDTGYVTALTETSAVDYNFRGGKISPVNDNANIHMWLTCIRYKNYPVLAIVAPQKPVIGGGTGGNPSNPQWYNATYSAGQLGQTCKAWLTANNANYNGTSANTRIPNLELLSTGGWLQGGAAVGSCMYRYDAPQSGTAFAGTYSNTYCKSGPYDVGIPGARPVASCDDSNTGVINNGPNTTVPWGSRGITQLRY